MARKGDGGRRQRQRRQQVQYEELDKYPVMPPHAFARIVRDLRTLNIIYQVIEPPLTKKEEEVRALGFDDRFIRFWKYYLSYCEAGFRERSIGLSQLAFAAPENRSC